MVCAFLCVLLKKCLPPPRRWIFDLTFWWKCVFVFSVCLQIWVNDMFQVSSWCMAWGQSQSPFSFTCMSGFPSTQRTGKTVLSPSNSPGNFVKPSSGGCAGAHSGTSAPSIRVPVLTAASWCPACLVSVALKSGSAVSLRSVIQNRLGYSRLFTPPNTLRFLKYLKMSSVKISGTGVPFGERFVIVNLTSLIDIDLCCWFLQKCCSDFGWDYGASIG